MGSKRSQQNASKTAAQEPLFEGTTIEVDENSRVECPHCRQLLAKGTMGRGTRLEIRCNRGRCRRYVRFQRM